MRTPWATCALEFDGEFVGRPGEAECELGAERDSPLGSDEAWTLRSEERWTGDSSPFTSAVYSPLRSWRLPSETRLDVELGGMA